LQRLQDFEFYEHSEYIQSPRASSMLPHIEMAHKVYDNYTYERSLRWEYAEFPNRWLDSPKAMEAVTIVIPGNPTMIPRITKNSILIIE